MALEATGGPPSLILAPNSRLKPTEIDSLTRLSKQLGSTLLESAHVGEEVRGVGAGTTKTIDVTGHGNFYKDPGFKLSQFFAAIKRHVLKSSDYTAIDLKGATKEQISAITNYVNTLDKNLRDKIIYIAP